MSDVKGEVPVPPDLKRILVTTDFSEGTGTAMDFALALAQEAPAEITLLHVLEQPPETKGSLEEVAAILEEHLDSMVPDEVRNWCTVKSEVKIGASYRRILETVHGNGCGSSGDEHSRKRGVRARVTGRHRRARAQGRLNVPSSRFQPNPGTDGRTSSPIRAIPGICYNPATASPPFSRVFVAKSRRRRQGKARAGRAPEAYLRVRRGARPSGTRHWRMDTAL